MECTAHRQGQPTVSGPCPCSDAEMNPFCKSLNAQTRCKLCAASRQLRIKRGATIPVSEFASEMLIVKSGVVASALLTENGKTQGAFIAQKGYVANIIRIAGRTERYDETFNDSHFGCAFTDACLCAVQIEAVRKCFHEDPEFAWKMFSEISDRCKDVMQSLTLLTEMSGAEKVAWVLDELEGMGVDLTTVTHESIGRILNMNRVSVMRVMAAALEQRARRQDFADAS